MSAESSTENLNDRVEELISNKASYKCPPKRQQIKEIRKFNLDIPDSYTDQLNVKMENNNPIILLYYINTEYAENSKIHKLSEKLTESAEKYSSIELQHVYDKTNSEQSLGFKLKLSSG